MATSLSRVGRLVAELWALSASTCGRPRRAFLPIAAAAACLPVVLLLDSVVD